MSKNELVDYLIKKGVLRTPTIIRAFKKIDRADFILPEFTGNPYADYPLMIGYDQTISQPTTVAFMLELLAPKRGEKILDIGSGSGWVTSLLAKIVGKKEKVLGTEIIPELVKFGKENLAKHHFPNAKISLAGKKLGCPGKAPFDKILVSAAARNLPQILIDQLKIGGRLILPIQNSIFKIDKIADDQISQQEFSGFVFVPLRY